MNKKKRNELNRIKDIMKSKKVSFSLTRDIVRGKPIDTDDEDDDYYKSQWNCLIDIKYLTRWKQ